MEAGIVPRIRNSPPMLADVRPTELWTTASVLGAIALLALVVAVVVLFVIRRR